MFNKLLIFLFLLILIDSRITVAAADEKTGEDGVGEIRAGVQAGSAPQRLDRKSLRLREYF